MLLGGWDVWLPPACYGLPRPQALQTAAAVDREREQAVLLLHNMLRDMAVLVTDPAAVPLTRMGLTEAVAHAQVPLDTHAPSKASDFMHVLHAAWRRLHLSGSRACGQACLA